MSVLVAGRYLDELGFEPGQFFRWRFLSREGWWQSHPFSLSAAPRTGLMQETLDAQSAQVDMVSGATFTSQGYIQSLQSALDQLRH